MIVNYKFGREPGGDVAKNVTHIIKLGFDAREASATMPKPGKYNGFMICRNRRANDGNLQVDYEAMQSLGYKCDDEFVRKARGLQLTAPDGMLPTELMFILRNRAVRDEAKNRWLFPGTFDNDYEKHDKKGLFCRGDGEWAMRRQEDGTKRRIECIPFGRADITDAKQFCPFSKDKTCGLDTILTLSLFVIRDGKPQPLTRTFGANATYLLETNAGYSPLAIQGELMFAADETFGYLGPNLTTGSYISGILSFGKSNKRTGEDGSDPRKPAVGLTQQIRFFLNRDEIQARRRELQALLLEDRKIQVLIEGPRASIEDQTGDSKEDEAQELSPFDDARAEAAADVESTTTTPIPDNSKPAPEPATAAIADDEDEENRSISNPSVDFPEPDQLSSEGVLECVLSDFQKAEGVTDGKPWKRYGVKSSKHLFGTFSDTHADVASSAFRSKTPVIIKFKRNGKYLDLTGIDPIQVANVGGGESDDHGTTNDELPF